MGAFPLLISLVITSIPAFFDLDAGVFTVEAGPLRNPNEPRFSFHLEDESMNAHLSTRETFRDWVEKALLRCKSEESGILVRGDDL